MPPDTPPQESPQTRDTAKVLSHAPTIRDEPATINLPAPVPGASRHEQPLPIDQHIFTMRYVPRDVIGQGGMGEVRLCRDLRIGRDVALKIRKPHTGASEGSLRFVREAKLQGQLEHPSIVPVYENLGATSDGEWFTMKRIRGETLERLLHDIADHHREVETQFGTRKLLALFVQVCNAVAYAHARGVVHRDLKPSNVMIGDFGEVYVLDWGVAKVLGTSEVTIADDDVLTGGGDRTLLGTIMGTPGYMAPEQARGEVHRVDARTDVYALGAILFELITLDPLHPLADARQALQSTVRGVDARPSARAPFRNPPPELDAVCVRATAMEPDDRYATARELATAVERFLDGDRDTALRRAAADEQIEQAKSILASSHGDSDAHAAALRALHRAYALDPTNEIAVRAMARLLLKPPSSLPAEAEEELAADEERDRRSTGRDGAVAFLAWLGLSSLWLLAGLRNVSAWLGIMVTLAACGIISAWVAFREKRPTDASAWAVLLLSTSTIAFATTYLGPFVLVPGWACQNTLVFAMYGRGIKRWVIASIGTLAFLVPLALELVGLIPPSFLFEEGRLVLLPRLVDIPPTSTLLILVVGNVAMVLVPALIVGRLRDQAIDTKRAHVAHLARLRQLVPEEARDPDASR